MPPFNTGSSAGILSATLKDKSIKACSAASGQVSQCVRDGAYNTAPFCSGMQPSLSSAGKPTAYGGIFDIISTYNAAAWPANTSANQGTASSPQLCNPNNSTQVGDGWMALCYSAGCRNQTAWNGMGSTCYCPIYRFKKGSPVYSLAGSASVGFSCTGQTPNSTTLFLQNGA